MTPAPADLLTTPAEWAAYRALEVEAGAYLATLQAAGEPKDVVVALHAFLTPHCLRRYLRARAGHADRAWTMLLATLEWRRRERPESVTEESVAEVLGLGTVFLAGRDRRGRPVVYMRPGAHNPYAAEQRVRFMVWLMEASVAATDETHGVEKLVWVLDFADFGQRANDAASRHTSRTTLDMLQNHYPERLGRAVLVNPPWYFRLLLTVG
jgi:hypothetical protein